MIFCQVVKLTVGGLKKYIYIYMIFFFGGGGDPTLYFMIY